MFDHFSIVFTGTGLLTAVAAPLAITFFLWIIAKSAPPAARIPGISAGVGGFMLVILFGLAADATIQLFELGKGAGEVARIISMDSSYAWPAIKTIIPGALSAIGVLLALALLTLGRSTAALALAILFMWAAGPLADLLKAAVLGIPFDPGRGFFGISFFLIIATIYLLFSNRAAFTYGLSSARRMEARWRAGQGEEGR